jgi:hypothetical protein
MSAHSIGAIKSKSPFNRFRCEFGDIEARNVLQTSTKGYFSGKVGGWAREWGGKRRLTDPDNVRFAKQLRKHRPHLLRFLYVEGLDATNNLAERQPRLAVIIRKTSGCNRAERGVESHAILASVLVTCRQQKRSLWTA